MNDKNEIGKRIKKAREFRVLGVVECAKLLGVDYTLLSRWENGRVKPRPKSIKGIAKALDVDANWLANGTNEFEEFIKN